LAARLATSATSTEIVHDKPPVNFPLVSGSQTQRPTSLPLEPALVEATSTEMDRQLWFVQEISLHEGNWTVVKGGIRSNTITVKIQ